MHLYGREEMAIDTHVTLYVNELSQHRHLTCKRFLDGLAEHWQPDSVQNMCRIICIYSSIHASIAFRVVNLTPYGRMGCSSWQDDVEYSVLQGDQLMTGLMTRR